MCLGFRRGEVRTGRGLYGEAGMGEGLGFDPNRREIRGDHAQVRVVPAPVCLDGMTSGAQVSAATGEKGKTVREGRNSGRGPEVGLGRSAAPRPSSYFLFFFFSSLFLL
jgi:hypothetical protein